MARRVLFLLISGLCLLAGALATTGLIGVYGYYPLALSVPPVPLGGPDPNFQEGWFFGIFSEIGNAYFLVPPTIPMHTILVLLGLAEETQNVLWIANYRGDPWCLAWGGLLVYFIPGLLAAFLVLRRTRPPRGRS